MFDKVGGESTPLKMIHGSLSVSVAVRVAISSANEF